VAYIFELLSPLSVSHGLTTHDLHHVLPPHCSLLLVLFVFICIMAGDALHGTRAPSWSLVLSPSTHRHPMRRTQCHTTGPWYGPRTAPGMPPYCSLICDFVREKVSFIHNATHAKGTYKTL